MNIWKNYLKITLRNLGRNRINAAVSIVGLVVSFIACVAIMQYVQFEKNYDGFHANADKLVRATNKMTTASGTTLSATTFYGAKNDYENKLPEVEMAVHVSTSNTALIKKGEMEIMQDDIIFASPEFFEIFNYPMLEGEMVADPDQNSIYLSQSTAQKLFPNRNALNQTLELTGILGQTWNVNISGIYKDLPLNTHMNANAVLPMKKMINLANENQFFGPSLTLEQVRWRWLIFHTYLKLDKDVLISEVEAKANEVVNEARKELDERLNQNHDVILQPVTEIHTTAGIENEFSPVNDRSIINLFAGVAFFILIIGWINYINLNTAKSVSRGKEVGIRKVLGSDVLQLKIQFQVEALVINLISFSVAMLLLIFLAPYLEKIADVQFFNSFFQSTDLILLMLATVLVGSFLSGLYPSHVLSNFKSIDVLKGRFKNSAKGVLLRRILVGIQFVFTLFLLSGLMVVQSQMDYMLGHNLGIDIGKTVVIDRPPGLDGLEGSGSMNALKNEMLQIPGVKKVSVASLVPGIENNWRNSTEDTEAERAGIFIHRSLVDHDYMDLYGIELLEGRTFDKTFGNEERSILLNLNAVQKLGYTDAKEAVGSEITFAATQYEIIGVVSDFYQMGVQFAIEPFTFSLDTALSSGFVTLKLASEESNTIAQIEEVFLETFPGSPFTIQIVEDVFMSQYENEQRFRTLFTLFTSIAVIIAVLGLLGLASFILNQRIKEICVRKVLGARSSILFLILNKEYFIINAFAFGITIPLAIFFMKNWLDGFENRIDIEIQYFLIPFLITFLVIMISTISHTLRVLKANPATILKEED